MLSPPRLSRHGPRGREELAGYRQDAGVGLDQALRTEPGGLERDTRHDDCLRRRSTHVHLHRCGARRVRKEASAEPRRYRFGGRQPAARVECEPTTRTSNWQDCTADHDPTAWEQHEAPLGLWQLHHLQLDAVLAGCRGWLLAGVALIDEGDLYALAGRRLYGLGQPADLSTIIGIGGRDVQRQEVAEGIHRHVQLRALLALGS